jgi:hypothetical protein
VSLTSSATSNDSNVAKQFDDPLELFAHIQKMASKEDGPPIVEIVEEESAASQSVSNQDEVVANRESSHSRGSPPPQINGQVGLPHDGSYVNSQEISRK